jgi:integrase
MSRIQEFLKMFTSQATVETYRWALAEYFKNIYGENEHNLEQHAERYFSEKRNYEVDIQNFATSISSRPPKTIRLMLAAVRSFLTENDVELSPKFVRRLLKRLKGNRALTLDKVPSNIELGRILIHMQIQGRALYLTLASSGMRIGEALQITPEDVEFDSQPVKINIRGEYSKTGNSRIAFISKEAAEAVQEWLKVRQDYLTAASGKSHRYGKEVQDSRLFPFEDNTGYAIWKNAVRKAGLLKKDPSTNRHTVHPHVLRKFFRTKLGSVLPVDVVEALMGHEGYLTEVYRRYSQEDLAKFYLQGEPSLLIFTSGEEVSKLRVEVEERNKQLQTIVNGVTSENLDLKSRVARMEIENTKLEKRIQAAEQRLEEVEKVLRDLIQG